MEGNLLQFIAVSLFSGFIVAVCVWQLIATSLAKKRRIAREKAAVREGLDGAGI